MWTIARRGRARWTSTWRRTPSHCKAAGFTRNRHQHATASRFSKAAAKKKAFTSPVAFSSQGKQMELLNDPSEPMAFMAPESVPVRLPPMSEQVVQLELSEKSTPKVVMANSAVNDAGLSA